MLKPALTLLVAWFGSFVAARGDAAAACQPPQRVMGATPAQVRSHFAADGREVVTFMGYSGAGYEDPAAMLAQAGRILGRLDPKRTLINIGATADGIGAVYPLAKQRGFATTGIVSMEAARTGAEFSPCVDLVFFVDDATWGSTFRARRPCRRPPRRWSRRATGSWPSGAAKSRATNCAPPEASASR